MTHVRTRIKICGLTREQDVDAAVANGADAIGFVLYERSARHVSIARMAELAKRLPPFVMPVCLFVNASPDLIDEAMAAVPNALLQFHGDEGREQCEQPGRPYLRAIRMAPGRRFARLCVWLCQRGRPAARCVRRGLRRR